VADKGHDYVGIGLKQSHKSGRAPNCFWRRFGCPTDELITTQLECSARRFSARRPVYEVVSIRPDAPCAAGE
jgi:hypothetical protein